LRCPTTGSELTLEATDVRDNDVVQGRLIAKEGGAEYAIRDGIAEMLPRDTAESAVRSLGAYETRCAALEKGFLTRLFTPFEFSAFRDAIELGGSDWVLEVSCGRGRITESLSGIPHRYVALDRSLRNLHAALSRTRERGFRYVSFVQADPLFLPFARDSFDKVLTSLFVSHVGTESNRSKYLSEIARVAKPSGRIVVSGYSYDLFASIRRDKSGTHKGGLEYFRFTRQEFLDLLKSTMLVDEVTQKLQYAWVGHGVPIKEHSVRIT
jgi:SAM-dependent methyltransferase